MKYENKTVLEQENFMKNIVKKLSKKNLKNTMHRGIVYLITNKINNKVYVGITTLGLKRRWDFHRYSINKLKYPLYRAMRKYGINNFKIEELCSIYNHNKKILIKNLNKLESKYIKKYRSFIPSGTGGYNLTEGGGCENKSVFSIEKQRQSLILRYKNNPNLGKIQGLKLKNLYASSEQMRNQAREVQIKRFKNPQERKNISMAIKNSYLKHPEYGERSSKVHIELNKRRPELGRQHSLRISGKCHPRFNSNIYTFKNKITNEMFTGTSFDFRKKYNLTQSRICLLVNKKTNIHKNWVIID